MPPSHIGNVDRFNAFVGAAPGRSSQEDATRGGMLSGVRIGVKDCFFHRGRNPTMGSRVMPPPRPEGAPAIERIEAAGGVVAGYTNLHEWAVAATSAVTATGPVRNPWNTDLVAGGSSGGSAAAVAAGLVDVAVGTDAGGSVRIPAACCGVVGFKPTFGLVPTAGDVCEGGPTEHVGALARSTRDAAALVAVMAAADLSEPIDPATLRVGVAAGDGVDGVVDEVADALETAVGTLGAIAAGVVTVDAGDLDHAARVNGRLFLAWNARIIGSSLDSEGDKLHPSTYDLLERARALTKQQIASARAEQERWSSSWDQLFEKIDVLVTPTLPVLPPRIDASEVVTATGLRAVDPALGSLNGAMNLTGAPSLSLPCGDADELTVNMSLTAAPGRDVVAISLGAAFEDATERRWVGRVAPL